MPTLPVPSSGLLDIETYRQYYSMGQTLVVNRIARSFSPWRRDFFDTEDNRPDIYGPFWIMTTVVFLLSSMGNIARYFNHWAHEDFIFTTHHFRYAVLLVYTLGFGLPLLLAGLLRLFRSSITLVQVQNIINGS
jgi:hypothetical protein